MLQYIALGGGFAFAAIAQPGPLQAFLLSKVASSGWKRTLPASLAPVISDGPIAFTAILILGHVSRGFESFLKLGGGCVFLYFAITSFLEWKNFGKNETPPDAQSPRTLGQAVVVNLLNPHPYLGWSLILGPAFIEAWRHNPLFAVSLVVSFYTVIVFGLALFIIIAGVTTAIGDGARRGMLLASSIAMAGIAVWAFWSSTSYLLK